MQRTIQTEFASSTILCIAHRLNTIGAFSLGRWKCAYLFPAWYDQVLVLDAGRLVEHGSPLDLFDAKGIFWSLCTEASLSREDIVRIRVAVTGG
jgi:ATP-binding cassette subfamily C (CFTR/MRP) protein 1